MLRNLATCTRVLYSRVNLMTLNIALAAFLVDQFIKFVIRSKFMLHESLPVFRGVFHVTFVKNYGAALGFLKGRNDFLILSAVASIILLLAYSQRVRLNEIYYKISLGLLLGGALGNLFDRCILGFVVDYFDLRFFPAIFNMADLFIDVGVLYLFYRILTTNEETFWPFVERSPE
ncbi:MAG: signal peptidase II [Candidatus Wallbacteria bacterium]|nr:signal peptidase II [Candidatus Wallbacteria bacterium]